MYFKFKKGQGKYFTFFVREQEVNGEKVKKTDKCVFARLSEGIKKDNGEWDNDYWNAVFCGKAYQKALSLKNKDRILIEEMTIRNRYSKETKRSYPSITIFSFSIVDSKEKNAIDETGFDDLIPDDDTELPF